MEPISFGFIGGGRITRILLQAYKNNAYDLSNVAIFDTNTETLKNLKSKFPEVQTSSEDVLITVKKQIIFIAVHPPVLMETLAKIKDSVERDSIVVSLAPKITLEKISVALGNFSNIARMNPSASSIINKGLNPVSFLPSMSKDAKSKVLSTLKPLGYLPEVQESKIEAYAVVSAMGHTYFFFQLQKLKELAIHFGMEESEAKQVISEMLNGTSDTLFNSGLSYNEVADLVPVKPLGEFEETIKSYYEQNLTGIFNKIKP